MYSAFYRKRPGPSNVHNVLWEASWIALSVLFVAIRAVKLTFVGAVQIGGVDVPFLAEGVGEICGVKLDRFPDIFRQDILAHEAHNHPYIQRLSKIYLLLETHICLNTVPLASSISYETQRFVRRTWQDRRRCWH